MDMNQGQELGGEGRVDREGAMAKADLYKLANYSLKLFKQMHDDDQLEGWVQAKITKAADYIASVYHYLEYEMKFSEYGKHLDNAETLNESQKAELKTRLSEAKKMMAKLKKAQAEKAEKVEESKKCCCEEKGKDKCPVHGKKKEVAEAKKAKPDFLDLDKDGDKKEPMKQAARQAKEKKVDEMIGSEEDKPVGAKRKTQHGIETKVGKGITKHERSHSKADDKDLEDDEDDKSKAKKVKESAKPSAGLSKAKKSATVKKAKKGEDIGKKGKGFKAVAAKAAKEYGSKEKGEKVAAAAMWKNIKRESVEVEGFNGPEDEPEYDAVDDYNLPPAKRTEIAKKRGEQPRLPDTEKHDTRHKRAFQKRVGVYDLKESVDLDRIKKLSGL